jgi:hypothetical protein
MAFQSAVGPNRTLSPLMSGAMAAPAGKPVIRP